MNARGGWKGRNVPSQHEPTSFRRTHSRTGTDEGCQTVITACPLPCRLVFPGPNPSLPGSDPSSSANRDRGDGDNLLGPLPPTAAAGPPLMVDWPKSPVGRTLFHRYTASGTARVYTNGNWQLVQKGLLASPFLLPHFLSTQKYLGSLSLFSLYVSLWGRQTGPHLRADLAPVAPGALSAHGTACARPRP